MELLTNLMPHQEAAVNKLSRLRVGALLLDMGTGKSRCAIELAARRQDRISCVLWFCPVALKDTICHEIKKHSAGESVYCFDDKTTQRRLPKAFWYVVGIESMSSSRRVILAANSLVDSRAMVIVDESSYIKGHRACRTEYITRIGERARYRLILTGTPVSQGVQDLFSQLRFLSPDILGYRSFYGFAANHLEYSERFKGLIVAAHNTGWIAAKMAPYCYQVQKSECLDLPEKLYCARYCRMTGEQRRLYERAKDSILLECTEDEFDSFTIFRLFTALQQITCGFWNYYPKESHYRPDVPPAQTFECSHYRLDLLESTLNEIAPSEKVVIWAKYRRCIEEIQGMIEEHFHERPARFSGDLSERERAEELQRFRGDARFLIATPSCGGHGLTLNEAAHHVFYTNGFRYSERVQAEDRSHRIGQDRSVTYTDIACLDSIDMRIEDALKRKASVVNEFRDKVQKIRDRKTLAQAIKEL